MKLPNGLTKDDGSPFSIDELAAISDALELLDQEQRDQYAAQNSEIIAKNPSKRMLIVSGPGTGKSYLFLKRIQIWLNAHEGKDILVTSFVRKLVADLQADVRSRIPKPHQNRITISTLHRLARSIVEKNHGNSQRKFQPYLKIVGPSWNDIVWADVLCFHPELKSSDYLWAAAEKQFHEDSYLSDGAWSSLFATYMTLTALLNAANFCDLIVAARIAVQETPGLNTDHFFIIDEYQDFNRAEGALLDALTQSADGMLIVGDDDQVLYETLKSGRPDLIRALYSDCSIVNAILPFCRRCDFHITKAAAAFIGHDRVSESIDKLFLSKNKAPIGEPVHIVGCASPSTAVDYIRKFIEEHRTDIEQRKTNLDSGTKKDAFLLILTPARQIRFYGPEGDKLVALVGEFKRERHLFSEDYHRTLTYYSLAKNPRDNFAFRKVFEYEGVSVHDVHDYLTRALSEEKALAELDSDYLGQILEKCKRIEEILEAKVEPDEKVENLVAEGFEVEDGRLLARDLSVYQDLREGVGGVQEQEELQAEAVETGTREMSAVEVLTIVSSKGLSADHVVIIGFDNLNMKRLTKNAFFVAMTRARQTLHLLTALKSGGATAPHHFVDALPEANVKFEWYKKKDRTLKAFANRPDFLRYLDFMRKTVSGNS